MSLLNIPLSSIRISTEGGSQFARASRVHVRRPVTEEISIANLVVDYEWAEDLEDIGRTIEVGDSINIYLGRDPGSMYHIFGGRIWRLEKRIDGHVPRQYDIQASGWGKYLQDTWIGYASTTDTVDNVISYIVNPLITGGTLSIGSIYPSNETVTWDHLNDDITMFDSLLEIAKDKDWDFYVDQDRKFYAFPKGSMETSETFSNIIKNLVFVKDGNDIVNAQRIVGQMARIIGTDADYTENASGWTTDGETIAAIRETLGVNRVIVPDPDAGTGTFAIRAIKADASGGMWARKTFGSPVDLSLHGSLHFSFTWEYDAPHGIKLWYQPKHVTLEIRFETDSSNYFTYYCAVSGEVTTSMFIGTVLKWIYGWHEVDFPFNIRTGNAVSDQVGFPTWTNIASIKFTVQGPNPTAGDYSEGMFLIDNMYFDQGFYYSFRYDSTSIGKYGQRRGPIQYHSALKSNTECEILADAIVTNYKNPVSLFESMNLTDIPSSLVPGAQATITVDEIVNTSQIRAINYSLEEYDLGVNLELSSRFVPSFDKIISDVKKAVDLTDQMSLPEGVIPSGIIGLLRGPLGQKDIDMAHGRDNLILNPNFEIDSDGDGIPDNWTPVNTNLGYRTEDDYRHGQWAGKVDGGETLYSEYFPIDITGGYIYEGWAKSSLSGSRGTFSMYIEYYNTYPGFAALGTVAIAESVNANIWTMYTYIEDADSIPVTTLWGRMKLVGDSGTVNFFDDLKAMRLVGVDAGRMFFTRPAEYSTANQSYVMMYAETWSVHEMHIRYIVSRVGVEIKAGGGDDPSSGRIIIKFDGTPADTFDWSTQETEYQRMIFDGTIDGGFFGATLSVEYLLKTGGATDVAYMRNVETWVSTYALKSRLLIPFGDLVGTPVAK